MYRGDVNLKEVMDSINRVKASDLINLVDWSPTGIQLNYTSSIPK